MGPNKLADTLEISLGEAKELIPRLKQIYPSIPKWTHFRYDVLPKETPTKKHCQGSKNIKAPAHFPFVCLIFWIKDRICSDFVLSNSYGKDDELVFFDKSVMCR